MVIKRVPLFIVGLLYGAVMGSVALGLAYALYAAAITLSVLDRGLATEGLITLAIIAVPAAIGFVLGFFYGLLTGSWHCAMDFYNNGFVRGLSSPFRFSAARWSNDVNRDSTKLKQYYASTEMGLAEKRKMAQQEIEKRARFVKEILDKCRRKPKSGQRIQGLLPMAIIQKIAEYAISPHEVDLPSERDIPARVGDLISSQFADGAEAKRTKTAADFFTPAGTAEIIRKYSFFSESSRSKRHQHQNQASMIPHTQREVKRYN